MDKDILASELIEIIKKNAYGRSLTFKDGWVKVETIYKIAKLIEDGSVDRMGKVKGLGGIKI